MPPVSTVRLLRQALWDRVADRTLPVPVVVVDEACYEATTFAVTRRSLLRSILRAVGMASIFLGRSIEVVRNGGGHSVGSRGGQQESSDEWATFLPSLPCTHPSEYSSLSQRRDLTVVGSSVLGSGGTLGIKRDRSESRADRDAPPIKRQLLASPVADEPTTTQQPVQDAETYEQPRLLSGGNHSESSEPVKTPVPDDTSAADEPAPSSLAERMMRHLCRKMKLTTKQNGDVAHGVNPLVMYLFARALQMPQFNGELDTILAAVATYLYKHKPGLRTITGLKAQVQYMLGDPLDLCAKAFVQHHFAYYPAECQVNLEDGRTVFWDTRGAVQPWRPVPVYPTLESDPLLPLVLSGCCNSAVGYPAPFGVLQDGCLVRLTSAAAVLIARSCGCGDPCSLLHYGKVSECILSVAVMCASRAHGVGGITLSDFLLQLGAELLAEVPALPLTWTDPSTLSVWYAQHNMKLPCFASMRVNEAYPAEAVGIDIGYFTRGAGKRAIDGVGRLASTGGTVDVVTVEACNCSGALAEPAFERFVSGGAPVGIAVVPSLQQVRATALPADAIALKVVVDGISGTVSLQPVVAVGSAAPTTSGVRKRVLFVFECNETLLTETLRSGALRAIYGSAGSM
jgi:hypothetical protein